MVENLNDQAREGAPSKGDYFLFLSVVLFGLLASVLVGALSFHRDHIAAIRSGRAPEWYQDMGGARITEIQDQDLFLHGIGTSASNAASADIVIVGSSLVAFAIDGATAREALQPYDVSFFNLAFIGISSGEFTRLVLRRNGIRPRLLIINADDGGGGGSFFSKNTLRSFSSDIKAIGALGRWRVSSMKEVARRNLLWRAQQLELAVWSDLFRAEWLPPSAAIFRSSATGEHDMTAVRRFNATNPAVPSSRDPDCHTTPEIIANARRFVSSVGSRVVLTLVPNLHYCVQQAREIADALGIELILAGRNAYSSIDGGGHLDREGAKAFTSEFLAAILASSTFHDVFRPDARP